MEVLYRVYVVAIFAAIGLGVLAGAINEAPAGTSALAEIRAHAPAIIGIGIAIGVLAGLRSGSHGGPLAIEPAEVQYTLLAPLDRGRALRPAALAQLRIVAICGAVLGAVVGNFVFRRFPGSPVEWIVSLALFGALVPVTVLGGALLGSGRRLTLALVGVGLLWVGGILLEAARRRAALAAELRFSASVRDLRTVILLRRQLSAERPRRRPWLRVGSAGSHPFWRRGWQSFMRWPAMRVARVLAIAVAAGGVAVAAWKVSVVLAVIPGPLLFVAALDLVEPLAQEADHPTRLELLPVDAAEVSRRHLAAPSVAMAAVVALAGVAAAVLAGDAVGIELGLVLALPTGFVLVASAAFSATNDPYAYLTAPQIGYMVQGAPIFVAVVALAVPILAARATWLHSGQALAGAIPVEVFAIGVGAMVAFLLSERMAGRITLGAGT